MTAYRRITRALGTVLAVVAAAAVGVVVSSDGGRVVNAVGDPLGAGGEFHAITPNRILDTRDVNNDVSPAGRKPMGFDGKAQVFDVPIVGTTGLPKFKDANSDGFDDNVLAVAVNITVIAPTAPGYLRAFGKGTPEGTSSTVNFKPGERVPNSAILRPGKDGKLSIRIISETGTGLTNLAIDISGWYSSSTWAERGARTITVNPARIYDSREAKFGAKPLGNLGQVNLKIRGAKEMTSGKVVVPDDPSVVGVIVNLTGVNKFPTSKLTYLSIIPDKVSSDKEVTTSNLNLLPGQFRANLAIVPLPADGQITLFNLAGSTTAIVDVVGYLRDGDAVGTRAGRIVPLVSPFRAFDTREAEYGSVRLGPGRAEVWSFESFVQDVKIGSDPVGEQVGLFANLTATGLQRQYPWAPVQTFLTAYPATTSNVPPNVSNLNLGENSAVPNLALMRYGTTDAGTHQVAVYNSEGSVHYLLDVYAVVLGD